MKGKNHLEKSKVQCTKHSAQEENLEFEKIPRGNEKGQKTYFLGERQEGKVFIYIPLNLRLFCIWKRF